MAQLNKSVLIGIFGKVAGTKLYNWLDPCCTEFCTDVNACVGGSSNALLVANVTVTSAQIINSFTTPVPILPTPGVGKQIQLLSVQGYTTFNKTAYTFSSAFGLIQDTAVSTSSGFIDNSAIKAVLGGTISESIKAVLGVSANKLQNDTLYNKPVLLAASVGNPASGDSPLNLQIVYTITT